MPQRTWSYYRHMPVYLKNGRLLGRAEEISHSVDFIHVQQGHVLVQDWYVPIEAVADVSVRGIRLSRDLGQMREHGWNVPPRAYLAQQGATPGYEYVSPVEMPVESTSRA